LVRRIEFGVPSIDDVLTWFSSRKEVVELGKVAIAHEILKGERASHLYNLDNAEGLAAKTKVGSTWMPHFLSMVMDGHPDEYAERAFETVAIVNFNYDRTIEHFLYSALQYKFGLPEGRANGIVRDINIIRPYGSLGHLPWQGDSSLPFGGGKDILAASKNILTYIRRDLPVTSRCKFKRRSKGHVFAYFWDLGSIPRT
jgi:hypothetical protein